MIKENKIAKITIGKLQLPLIKPYVTALRRVNCIDDIVIIIKTENELIGYGSAAATTAITGDSQGSIIDVITNLIAPKLIGKEITQFAHLLNLVQLTCERNTSAKAAVDIALHDLYAKHCNLPLYQFLGGGPSELNTGISVSLNTTEQMIKDAIAFVTQGFKALKIKAGINIHEDINRITAIRQAVGQDITLYVDANQGWNPKQALQALNTFVEHGTNIAMIEQPVKAQDLTGLKFVRDNVQQAVFADEACFSPHDALNIISNNIADGICIKLMKSGGIYSANAMYSMSSSCNLPCLIGCMLESPISITAMVSFAVSKMNIAFIDLDPLAMIKNNPITGGVKLTGPKLVLSDKPGLGIEDLGNSFTILHEIR